MNIQNLFRIQFVNLKKNNPVLRALLGVFYDKKVNCNLKSKKCLLLF